MLRLKNKFDFLIWLITFLYLFSSVTKEMLHILQDYGEVACCFGSIANIENTSIFLQADCRYSPSSVVTWRSSCPSFVCIIICRYVWYTCKQKDFSAFCVSHQRQKVKCGFHGSTETTNFDLRNTCHHNVRMHVCVSHFQLELLSPWSVCLAWL